MTSFSRNRRFLAFCFLAAFLCGCAAAAVRKPFPKESAPPLTFKAISPDPSSPQAAAMAVVRWKADASGGVGRLEYEFWSFNGSVEVAEQKGPSPMWEWRPAEPGTYRVRSVVRDSIGNSVKSEWSAPYVVAPRLVVSSLTPDKPAPQAAEMGTVRWAADVSGGVGERRFEFVVTDGKEAKTAQKGPSSVWDWKPAIGGSYQVKSVVRDSLGNMAESGWSPVYRIVPKLVVRSLSPDKAAPQAAEMVTVRWKADAAGGMEERSFEFLVNDGKREEAVQSGPSPIWEWKPTAPGSYRVKVVIRDSLRNKAESGWSPEYAIAPPMVVSLLPPDRKPPQAAGMATVRWNVESAGGVGGHTYEFRMFNGKEEKTVQRGSSGQWDWIPSDPGNYRMKAVVRDSIGNMVQSKWSPDYTVVPKLEVSSLVPEVPSPQSSLISNIRWVAGVEGGVGSRIYTFSIFDGKEEKVVQGGPSASWEWSPRKSGTYRVKVAVRDSIGNATNSGWSPDFEIVRPLDGTSLIAVMPMANLTGTAVSARELRRSIVEELETRGFNLLGEDALEKFMERHRIRYTGGFNKEVGEALGRETGTKAVLVVTLTQYDESAPPKVALISRLVSTGPKPVILWTDSVDLAGNDAPGLLATGLIRDPRKLWRKALGECVASLATYVGGRTRYGPRGGEAGSVKGPGAPRKFRPKNYYGTLPKLSAGKQSLSIAVLPFLNESSRRNAGEIMVLNILRGLSGMEEFEVVEPGVVRQALLMSRTIMEGGLSLPQADLLHSMLDVDLVLTGIVTEYKDYSGSWGNAEVDFSTRVFDMKKRQVVWTSISHNRGDDGVFFFGLGRVNTAQGIATAMVRAAVGEMTASAEQDPGNRP